VESPLARGTDGMVSYALNGLKPNTTVHYRVVAANGAGTTRGYDRTFTTRLNIQLFLPLVTRP
jgi:hypothetical protein